MSVGVVGWLYKVQKIKCAVFGKMREMERRKKRWMMVKEKSVRLWRYAAVIWKGSVAKVVAKVKSALGVQCGLEGARWDIVERKMRAKVGKKCAVQADAQMMTRTKGIGPNPHPRRGPTAPQAKNFWGVFEAKEKGKFQKPCFACFPGSLGFFEKVSAASSGSGGGCGGDGGRKLRFCRCTVGCRGMRVAARRVRAIAVGERHRRKCWKIIIAQVNNRREEDTESALGRSQPVS